MRWKKAAYFATEDIIRLQSRRNDGVYGNLIVQMLLNVANAQYNSTPDC